jgi:molybdate-binding protein/transcriptional regulator with XRE-family HTH domain
MADEPIRNDLRRRRELAGEAQHALAARAGISRQALSALEAGRAVPSVAVALRLARALGTRVEDLFALDDETLEAEPAGCARTGRVALGRVDGRWVAHFLAPEDVLRAADGLVEGAGPEGRVRVRPLAPVDELGRALLLAGCAPPLALLAERSGERATWIAEPSEAALDMLARGRVHVAGAHLLDEASGEFNVAAARRIVGPQARVVTLARWEQGLVVAPGNPLGLRTVADLLRPGLRFAGREPGAGAHRLLERLARREGLPVPAPGGPVVRGHMEVAQAVALGAADAGIAIRAAALAWGQGFVPLAEERFDLVLRGDPDPRLDRLLDALDGRPFRRELASLGGYGVEETGQQVAA